MRATWAAQIILLDLITLIIFGETCKWWSSLLCSLLQPTGTSSRLGPNIILIILFSNTLSSIFFPQCLGHEGNALNVLGNLLDATKKQLPWVTFCTLSETMNVEPTSVCIHIHNEMKHKTKQHCKYIWHD